MRFEVIGPITGQRTIAVGGRIRGLRRLVAAHGKGRWRKMAGVALIRRLDGSTRLAELHWYEATGIGRRKMKVKHYLD
jgi:hypothetical protein